MDELEVVKAIYPEATIRDKSCYIEIPVELKEAVDIVQGDNRLAVTHLPPLKCTFSLPAGYPEEECPVIEIGGGEGWMSDEHRKKLVYSLEESWNMTHDLVLYAWIDQLTTTASEIGDSCTSIDAGDESTFRAIAEGDRLAKRKAFEDKIFECGICLNEHPGSDSLQFDSCKHVFCKSCLKDYMENAIRRGEIDKVHCPSFECTKKHVEDAEQQAVFDTSSGNLKQFEKEFFDLPMSMVLLSQILTPENDSLVERFLTLYKRDRFDRYKRIMPQRVLECPRELCKTPFLARNDSSKLAICTACHFAFCSVCNHSWHGEVNSCRSIMSTRVPVDEMDEWINSEPDSLERKNLAFKYGRHAMELAVEEYLSDKMFEQLVLDDESGIVRCPACKTPIQRSEGCNKMVCSQCLTYFCNLCGEILSKEDPYAHFNDPILPCYKRLFDGLIKDE